MTIQQDVSMTPRVVPLEGAFNVRDLGGYRTGDGRIVNRGRFYRGDGLHKLTTQDQKDLLSRDITTVIDLRNAKELETAVNVFASNSKVSYYNVSLLNPAHPSGTMINSLGDLYVMMLDMCGPLFREVMLLMAESNDEAVLFHCSAGKDRTGMISALLLDLAGVPKETIIEDYALTSQCLAPIMDELRLGRPAGISAEDYEKFLGCDPAHMERMMSHLYSRYGGALSYLTSIGVQQEQLDILKNKLIGT